MRRGPILIRHACFRCESQTAEQYPAPGLFLIICTGCGEPTKAINEPRPVRMIRGKHRPRSVDKKTYALSSRQMVDFLVRKMMDQI